MDGSRWTHAALAGVTGAVALTTIHQAAQMFTADAPRMDVLGRRAIAVSMERGGLQPPGEPTLQRWALAGDLLANSLYYGLITLGRGEGMWARAVGLGAAAGAGALVLPQQLGLGAPPRSFSTANQLMTIGWYTLGAVVAAAVAAGLRRTVASPDLVSADS